MTVSFINGGPPLSLTWRSHNRNLHTPWKWSLMVQKLSFDIVTWEKVYNLEIPKFRGNVKRVGLCVILKISPRNKNSINSLYELNIKDYFFYLSGSVYKQHWRTRSLRGNFIVLHWKYWSLRNSFWF